MKLRKLLAGMLTLALGMSVGVPALAQGADERLTQVAQVVINTLEVEEDYTSFYGEPNETPLGTRWELNWSGEKKSLNVSATETGKVVGYHFWEEAESVPYSNQYGPIFPEMTVAQAKVCAQAFLEKVLEGNEAAQFTGREQDSLSADYYYFNGVILLNGVPSPMAFSVRVRLKDGKVTSFWRGDETDYVGAVPAPETVTTAEKAADLLRGTVEMKLEYVLADRQEGQAPRAVLRYLPVYGDSYFVDAATGELVDLTELQKQLQGDFGERGMNAAAAKGMTNDAVEAESSFFRELTEAELAGVAKLEGVLEQDALEKAAKTWPELGLEGYAVASVSYSVDRETDEVTARVVFAKNTDSGVCRRTLTMDAKTGELFSMYSSIPMPWTEEEIPAALSADEARARADAFLGKLWGDQFAKTEVYSSSEAADYRGIYSFTFAQKVNGYFFPDNCINVSVDPNDGTIRSFSKRFDDTVVFDDAQGIITKEAAVAAWAATFPVKFGYLEVPVALNMDEPRYKALVDAGYKYYNALKPGYAYDSQDAWYVGVDAKTGEAVKGSGAGESAAMTYDDIEGHWAQAMLAELAQYNVGWFGGKADPDGALTQSQYLALLLSAEGYRFEDLTDADTLDQLYRSAVARGLLSADEREEDRALTRTEMVKLLLNSLGYGPVARLQGIFKCSFTDADAIPETDMGYAALAQGLGIVKGDGQGRFAPARTATRAEAAVMLWQYMKR